MKTHKYLLFFLSIWLLNSSSLPAVALENGESKSWSLSLGLDYLTAGNGSSELRQIANSICTNPNNIGSCTTSSTNASGAAGFRAMAFHKYGGIEWGPSVGYLNGGPGAGDISLFGPNGTTLNYGVSENTVRYLGEVRKIWGLMGNFDIRMGVGLGLASVNQVNSCEGAGTLNLACKAVNIPKYSSLGWLTWEISPSIVYKNLSFGVRYVGFGRGGRVPWNTFGTFLGIDF